MEKNQFLAIFRNEITTILTPLTSERVSGGGGVGHVSRYIIVCSGALFGQPRKNRGCASTGKFKKLTGPGSISAKNCARYPGRESTEEYY